MIRALHPEAVRQTVRALAVVENDEVLGVAGFYPQDGRLVLFGTMTDAARKEMNKDKFTRYKLALVLCAKKIMGMATEKRMPIVAMADPKFDGSDRLLEYLGFTQSYGRVYQWQIQ